MNNSFLSADDFKGGRLNMSIFTNLEKSHTPETLQAEFGEHTIITKAVIGDYVKDIYKTTGGEIVKGGFNDTPEVAEVLEKAKAQFALLIPVRLEDENGIEDAFIIKAKAEDEFEKGVYKDNAYNRANGLVGRTYGTQKTGNAKSNRQSDAHHDKITNHMVGFSNFKKTDEYKTDLANNLTEDVRKRVEEAKGKKFSDEEFQKMAEDYVESKYKNGHYDKGDIKKSHEPNELGTEKDEDELEKGKISNAFEYSSNIKFKKTGAEISVKMINQIAKCLANVVNIETELANLANEIDKVPTQTPYGGRFEINCPYRNFHWCLTDYVGDSGRSLNQACTAENGEQLYPSATEEEAVQYRKWNDLVYRWIEEQKELALIKLFSDNFDEKEKYELSAEQMIALGF